MNKNKTYRLLFLLISGIGLINALYLTWIKISNNTALCIPGLGDCWSVNTSIYSQVMGIPVSLIGAVGLLALILVDVFENRSLAFKPLAIYFTFGFTLIGVLFSAYLTYVEVFILHAICPFCVISAIIMLILFIMTVSRLVSKPDDDNS